MFVEKLNKEQIGYIMASLCPTEDFIHEDYESIEVKKHTNCGTQDHITVKVSWVKNALIMFDNYFETVFEVEDEEHLQQNYKNLMIDIFGMDYVNYLENENCLEN